MKKIKLNVKGMHCPSCEMLIKDSLEESDGIKNAELSNEKGTAIVTFDVSETYHWLRSQWTKSIFCSGRGYVSEHVKNHPVKGGASKICHTPQRVVFNESKINEDKIKEIIINEGYKVE